MDSNEYTYIGITLTRKEKQMGKKILEWALANYEKGGHWIYETMTEEDVEQQFASLKEAKEYCRLIEGINKEVNSW